MAHFAKLSQENIVEQIVVINNNDCAGGDFPESEQVGIAFCKQLFGGGSWKQTSYNENFRKNFASIGGIYDDKLDAFIPKKPFPSWVLNNQTGKWDAPIAKPKSGKWFWNEALKTWQEID